MDALEKLLRTQQEASLIRGEWFVVRWTPDIATGETLNIGVGFVEAGRTHFRLLDYFERISCFYGERAIYQAELVTTIVGESLRQNVAQSPIAQVIYQPKGYAQGLSINEILSNLFEHTVSLAKKVKEQKSKDRFSGITTEKLYTCLVDELKKIAGIDYEQFTPPNSSISYDDVSGSHELYIPFRDGASLLGGLASTVYSNVSTIELNLLKAARDVETALKLGKGKRPCVFLLKPGSQIDTLKPEQVSSIESILDKFDWHMTKQGIAVGSHMEISGLAQEIFEWSKVA
jgi:hypothetical protein